MPDHAPIILPHGGYRHLKSFQVAELLYDVTVQFCDRYIDKRSRTHDQMVQAARSGTRNIAEGSQTSGTSKKSEIRLTDVARASLEELLLDYKKFLRDQGWEPLPPKHPALLRFKERRCQTLAEVRQWVSEERKMQEQTGMRARTCTDLHGQTRTGYTAPAPVPVRAGPCRSVGVRATPPDRPLPSAVLAANAALSLLNLACLLLDRQLASLEQAFTQEGGFTERLYRVRSQHRPTPPTMTWHVPKDPPSQVP
ncbi:MAG: four helix bundle suffix domain-containing protein [Lentisphaeria bacterium]